jgi:hypothetical protein
MIGFQPSAPDSLTNNIKKRANSGANLYSCQMKTAPSQAYKKSTPAMSQGGSSPHLKGKLLITESYSAKS